MLRSERKNRKALGAMADLPLYTITYPQIKKIAALKNHIWGLQDKKNLSIVKTVNKADQIKGLLRLSHSYNKLTLSFEYFYLTIDGFMLLNIDILKIQRRPAMKKIGIIIAVVAVIVVISVIGIIFMKSNQSESIKTVSQVTLNSEQYVNSLKKISISGTNDYIMISEDVKWEVPKHDKGETVSFSIAIPYTITVDEVEYNGIYQLNDSSWNTDDNNPKYSFSVTNLTQNGEIEVLITTK